MSADLCSVNLSLFTNRLVFLRPHSQIIYSRALKQHLWGTPVLVLFRVGFWDEWEHVYSLNPSCAKEDTIHRYLFGMQKSSTASAAGKPNHHNVEPHRQSRGRGGPCNKGSGLEYRRFQQSCQFCKRSVQLKSLKDRVWIFHRWTWALTDFRRKETWREAQSSGPIIVLGTHLRLPFALFLASWPRSDFALVQLGLWGMDARNNTLIYTEVTEALSPWVRFAQGWTENNSRDSSQVM